VIDCSWHDYSIGLWRDSMALTLGSGILEIDLSSITGASKATITIDDNCAVNCTKANLYEGNNVVFNTGNATVASEENLVLNLSDDSSKITVWSCEGAVLKIVIE
jgi:hypothetical protein